MTVFTPFSIGSCTVKNRFVMTACNLGWCEDGHITQRVTNFYRERARGNVGLIIAGAAGVDPERVNTSGMMQVCDDSFIPGLASLASAVHNRGSRIFLQLMHAGAYARRSEHEGKSAVSPTAGFCSFTGEETEELSSEQIEAIIENFSDAAVRAMKAGFDGVELIGSAGYLISEFLSPLTNRRHDEYGGSFANRIRFLDRIIDAVREKCGDFPVMLRLSGSDFVEYGNGPEEFLAIGKKAALKADAIDVTGGWHESHVPQITYNVPRGMYLYLAHALKKQVNIPVIGCNRLDAEAAADAVDKGIVDAAGMLRPFIADPYLVLKLENDRVEDIRPCLSCNQMCLDMIFSGKGLGCVVNPYAGIEGHILKMQEYGENILVIGAGISGMAYAAMAAQSNHVTIWEKTEVYGGIGRLIARIPYRGETENYIEYLYHQCCSKGVKFVWNRDADAEELKRLIKDGIFSRVIIAAGSSVKKLEYPIDAGVHVMTPEECMACRSPLGRRVVIIGSDYRTVQIAQYCLGAEREGDRELAFLKQYQPSHMDFAKRSMGWEDKSLTIIAPGRSVGAGFGKSTKWMMLSEIKKAGVIIEEQASVVRIEKEKVIFRKRDGSEHALPADLIVACDGWIKNGKFAGFPDSSTDKIVVIGDALKPTTISGAIRECSELAFTISVL